MIASKVTGRSSTGAVLDKLTEANSRLSEKIQMMSTLFEISNELTLTWEESAALNLAYVASGRLDAYWATSVKPWDVAAGWLIASEAGARMRHIEGGEVELADPRFVAAGSRTLLETLHSRLTISANRAGS